MVLNLPVSLNQQKSTSNVLEFSTVETMALFDVFFRRYIADVEDQARRYSLLGLLKAITSMKLMKGYMKWRTHERQGP